LNRTSGIDKKSVLALNIWRYSTYCTFYFYLCWMELKKSHGPFYLHIKSPATSRW